VHRHATDAKPLKRLMFILTRSTGLKAGVDEITAALTKPLVSLTSAFDR